MKVITANPVIVNRKKIDNSSMYLSFDASGKPTTSKETQMFQDWMDAKYPGWVPSKDYPGGKLNKGSGYGKYPFGPSTANAWNKYGKEFVTSMKAMGNTLGTIATTIAGVGSGEPSKAEQIEQAKQGKVWDKAKGWVTSGKAAELLAQVQAAGGIKAFLGSFLRGGQGTQTTTDTGSTYTAPEVVQVETGKKWSTGKKVLVFGGGALVLGAIIYFATRKSK